jgi:hypothetical protein
MKYSDQRHDVDCNFVRWQMHEASKVAKGISYWQAWERKGIAMALTAHIQRASTQYDALQRDQEPQRCCTKTTSIIEEHLRQGPQTRSYRWPLPPTYQREEAPESRHLPAAFALRSSSSSSSPPTTNLTKSECRLYNTMPCC